MQRRSSRAVPLATDGRPRRLRRTAIIVLLALVASLSTVVIGTETAFADTTHCSGNSYSTCTDAGYTDHAYGSHNTTSYWNMYAGHNCTNYVAYVETTVNGATTSTSGNAYEWDNNAPAGSVNTTPGIGSVAQWEISNPNRPSGHVAYVESITYNANGSVASITVSEDNFSSGPFRWRTITTGGDWPDHFIHFKDLQGTYVAPLWPAVIQRASTGETDVVVQGPSNSLQYYYNVQGTADWGHLQAAGGGTSYSAPAVVQRSNGETDVAVQGPSNSLQFYFNTQGSADWGQLEIGGANTAFSAPAMVQRSNGETLVAVQGPTNSLQFYYNVQGQGTWGHLQIDGANTAYR